MIRSAQATLTLTSHLIVGTLAAASSVAIITDQVATWLMSLLAVFCAINLTFILAGFPTPRYGADQRITIILLIAAPIATLFASVFQSMAVQYLTASIIMLLPAHLYFAVLIYTDVKESC